MLAAHDAPRPQVFGFWSGTWFLVIGKFIVIKLKKTQWKVSKNEPEKHGAHAYPEM